MKVQLGSDEQSMYKIFLGLCFGKKTTKNPKSFILVLAPHFFFILYMVFRFCDMVYLLRDKKSGRLLPKSHLE